MGKDEIADHRNQLWTKGNLKVLFQYPKLKKDLQTTSVSVYAFMENLNAQKCTECVWYAKI